jgi:hypothetical protein
MKKARREMYHSKSGSEVECILHFGPEICREDTRRLERQLENNMQFSLETGH